MVENRRGFTLIELLAVITVLAIIIVIATTSVGGAITNSRNRSFIETMEVGVKNAKSVLATKGELNDTNLNESMDFKETQYKFTVENKGDYYEITLKPTGSKFKNVDFSKLTDKEKNETMFGYVGNTIIAYIKKNTGKLIAKPSDGGTGDNGGGNQSGGGGETQPPSPEPDNKEKIGKDSGKCVAMEKKSTYNVGDTIYICDSSNAKSNDKEEFYVLSSFIESDVKKYKLISLYGINGTGTQTDANTVFSMKYVVNTNEIEHMVQKAENYAKHISDLLNKKGISGTIADATDIISAFSNGSRVHLSYTYYTISDNFTGVLPLSSGYLACSTEIYTNSGFINKYIIKDGEKNEIRSVSTPIGNDVYAQIRPTIIVPAGVIEKES